MVELHVVIKWTKVPPLLSPLEKGDHTELNTVGFQDNPTQNYSFGFQFIRQAYNNCHLTKLFKDLHLFCVVQYKCPSSFFLFDISFVDRQTVCILSASCIVLFLAKARQLRILSVLGNRAEHAKWLFSRGANLHADGHDLITVPAELT